MVHPAHFNVSLTCRMVENDKNGIHTLSTLCISALISNEEIIAMMSNQKGNNVIGKKYTG